jgi:hypothetical protein
MNYEFQSTLHQNSHHMCAAIAHEWMTAGGMNSSAAISEILANPQNSARALATECIEAWDLNCKWLAERESTKEDIKSAFVAFIAQRPDKT